MKILLIHTRYKEHGGEDSVVENEMRLLQAEGHTVDILNFDNGKHSFISLLLLPFNPLSYFKTIHKIQKFQPHVVHIHNLHFAASLSVIRAVSHKKIAIVKTLHNFRLLCPSGTLFHNKEIYMKSLTTTFPWDAIRQKVYRNSAVLTYWLAFSMWLHKRWGTFKKVDRYIVLNEKARSIFLSSDLQLKTDQIIMKPNFINANTANLTVVRDNHFLFIGRLSAEKGIEVLLKTFVNNGLALTIIGDGPMRDEVIKAQQSNQQIKWMGFQGKEVIDAELRQCTALIVPSVCYEGMPLTIVEGFAAATPVITSRLGAMETIVTHNSTGLLFKPNDAVSLNRQLQHWLAFSEEKKSKISEQALCTYATKYTPKKNLSTLLSVYNEAMGKKGMWVVGSEQDFAVAN